MVKAATRMPVGLVCFVFVVGLSVVAPQGQTYVIDDTQLERRFDGIGGLSGGGATSKLLVNYPQQQRDEILDFLFKPNFGASLHICKVEIGGDSQSTDGTEASHMHDPWDENYQRGYEWWIMTEAKKRNPDIKLYGLPWAYPGWLGKGSGSPYTYPEVTAGYIVSWLNGAKKVYNLTIDYIGIWNERQYNITYVKTLRQALDKSGFNQIQIVVADGGWEVAPDILKDKQLAADVEIIGCHYPGTNSTKEAQETGKQLWSSEDYSTFNDDTGAGCWARILNQNYVNGLMTSTISWNLIAAYYEDLPFDRDGLMTAIEPWSGHYRVESTIWTSAHTTQFTQPGWTYLQHGNGTGHMMNGGTYVTLISPDKTDLTMVIETMTHDHSVCIRPHLPKYDVQPQTATFQLKGKFASVSQLNLWHTQLTFDGTAHTLFEKLTPVKVTNGQFSLDLKLDELYTVTTLSVGQKGSYPPSPPSKPFPLPYKDDYDSYKEYQEAYNFVPQVGSFEVRASSDPQHKMVNRQTVLMQPIDWCRNSVPITIGGNYNWTDVYMTVDFLVPQVNGTSGVILASRVQYGGCSSDKSGGVYFFLSITNQSYTFAMDPKMENTHVSGKIPVQLKPNTWYSMSLLAQGDHIRGYLNNQKVFEQEARSPVANGFVGYGTINFGLADFDNFAVGAAQPKLVKNYPRDPRMKVVNDRENAVFEKL